jgi:hypothetical protein
MVIGGTNTSLYHSETLTYVPVTDKGYWQVVLDGISRSGEKVIESQAAPAIIDTGTTMVITSLPIAQSFYANIPGAKAQTRGAVTYWTSKLITYFTIFHLINVCICAVPCDTINRYVPTFTLGGRDFIVSVEAFNLGPDNLSSDCMAGIAADSDMGAHGLWYL